MRKGMCMDLLKSAVQKMLEGQELLEVDPDTGMVIIPNGALGPLTDGIPLERILNTEEDLLGFYTPMASPGTITLCSQNLRAFFWHLVFQLSNNRRLPIMKADLASVADLVVSKTYHHEYFHFFCDIQRKLFPGSEYDFQIEEALAVAHSYACISRGRDNKSTKFGRMGNVIYPALMVEAFKYNSAGYRDWILYSDDIRFDAGLYNYISPPNSGLLQSNGINVSVLLRAQLDKIYSFGVLHSLI